MSELEAKLEKVANVSHTDVKELKEMHLASKALKSELSTLATRRFLRAREASTEQVVQIMTSWAQCKLSLSKSNSKVCTDEVCFVVSQSNFGFLFDRRRKDSQPGIGGPKKGTRRS